MFFGGRNRGINALANLVNVFEYNLFILTIFLTPIIEFQTRWTIIFTVQILKFIVHAFDGKKSSDMNL